MSDQESHRYRLQVVEGNDPAPNSIKITESDGSTRSRVNSWEELAAWLIEHGEHAALFQTGQSHEVLLVLPEPTEGLFAGLDLEPMPIAWTFEYAGGRAIAILAEAEFDSQGQADQPETSRQDVGGEGECAS